jgi:hypothetical protein
MYLKWIVCDVKKDKIHEFSVAQKKWDQVAVAEGFIVQLGGWNVNNTSEACILSIWEHKYDLENFMKDLHDQIFENNRQSETYNSIRVNHFYIESDIDSEAIIEMVKKSKNLIVSDYLFRSESVDTIPEFENPYIIGKNENNDSRLLVVNFIDQIDGNLDNIEIEKVEKKRILLVDSWRVCS